MVSTVYKVIDYYDLRPLDWLTGKRMPLGPGEGHVCDRCGAEHAVVYVVEDSDTGKTYRVGSSCAKANFGFIVTEDLEAKKLVKSSKQRDAEMLDAKRQAAVEELADTLASEISQLPVPECTSDTTTYHGTTAWKCGDGCKALASYGRTDAEACEIAVKDWTEHRVREGIPVEWDEILILYRPGHRDKTKISMARKVLALAASKI